MAGDVQSYLKAAPLPRFDVTKRPSGRKKRPWPALLLVLSAHIGALYWAMHHPFERGDRNANRALEITLIEPAVPQPVPELRKAYPVTRRASPPHTAVHAPSANTPAPAVEPPAPPVSLFNTDGSLRLPHEALPREEMPDIDIAKGRELMGRGLDCEAPDALGTGESLGEEVARKYLAWIGMYNPYRAQHRAELFEERKERCKRWRGQT